MATRNLAHIQSNLQFFSDTLIKIIDQTIEQIRISNAIYIRACNESHLRALDSLKDYVDSLIDMDQKTNDENN